MNFWENTWDADHTKYIKKAADIGFDILEFQAQALLNMSDDRMKELKSIADDRGIELTYSLGLDPLYDISSFDEEVRKAGMLYLSEIIECIHKMDGHLLSGVSYAGWGVPSYDFEKTKLFENSVSCMKELAKKAAEYNITYGIEAVNRFEGVIVNTAKEALEYVNAVDCENVEILLDTYHMNIEENSLGDAIRTAGARLVGLHVGENNRTAPGRGHLDWKEIYKALKDISFDGRIVAEPFVKSGGEVGRSICVWRDLITDISETGIDSEARYMLNYLKEIEVEII